MQGICFCETEETNLTNCLQVADGGVSAVLAGTAAAAELMQIMMMMTMSSGETIIIYITSPRCQSLAVRHNFRTCYTSPCDWLELLLLWVM